jgi:hypothetical protein
LNSSLRSLWSLALIQLAFFSQPSDVVELSLKREPVEHVDTKAGEDLQTCVEFAKRLIERMFSFVLAAGSWMPQWAVIGWPGHTGQTSSAARSQTVKTKSRGGASAVTNSSQLLLRRFSVGSRFLLNTSSGNGWTSPFG